LEVKQVVDSSFDLNPVVLIDVLYSIMHLMAKVDNDVYVSLGIGHGFHVPLELVP
jgi:hypothetical protein